MRALPPAATRAWLLGAIVAVALGAGTLQAGAQDTSGGGPDDVRVIDTSGVRLEPCEPVDVSGRFVSGGCSGTYYSSEMTISVRTAFGELPFGECSLTARVHVATDGRIWFDRLRIGGASPCNDVWPCGLADAVGRDGTLPRPTPLERARPWTGRVWRMEAEDLYTARVDMCVDTCAGRYAGAVEIEMDREDRDWILRAKRSGVGTTGFQLDGEWTIEQDAADLDGRFYVYQASEVPESVDD